MSAGPGWFTSDSSRRPEGNTTVTTKMCIYFSLNSAAGQNFVSSHSGDEELGDCCHF